MIVYLSSYQYLSSFASFLVLHSNQSNCQPLLPIMRVIFITSTLLLLAMVAMGAKESTNKSTRKRLVAGYGPDGATSTRRVGGAGKRRVSRSPDESFCVDSHPRNREGDVDGGRRCNCCIVALCESLHGHFSSFCHF